jgi:hypothetical protein
LFQPDTGVIDEKKSQNNLSPLYKDKDNTERTKKQSKHPKPHTLFQMKKDQLTVVSGAYAVWMLYFVLKSITQYRSRQTKSAVKSHSHIK